MDRDTKGQFVKRSGIKDMKGQFINSWEVLEYVETIDTGRNRRTYWLCKCKCGTVKKVRQDSIKATKSCGCHKAMVDSEKANKLLKQKNRKHCLTCDTKFMALYRGMIRRCTDLKDKRYDDYGGRGIDVCDEWRDNIFSFREWCIQNGNGYKQGLQLDRIDNNGHYEPKNCRFVTAKENCGNRRKRSCYKKTPR